MRMNISRLLSRKATGKDLKKPWRYEIQEMKS